MNCYASQANMMLQCPCCDYFTLNRRHRSDICPVCFWQDEPLSSDAQYSLANEGLTLGEARRNFVAFGACLLDVMPQVLPLNERDRFRYSPRIWRH